MGARLPERADLARLMTWKPSPVLLNISAFLFDLVDPCQRQLSDFFIRPPLHCVNAFAGEWTHPIYSHRSAAFEMLVSRIVQEHDRWTGQGVLCDSLGDGLVLDRSPTYRALRETALRHGIAFSSNHSAVAPIYKALSLFALPRMERLRLVAYVDNVTALRELCHDNQRFELDLETSLGTLYPNAILHETVHVLANAHLARAFPDADPLTRLTHGLLSESFATAVQTYAAGDRESASEVESLLLRINGLHIGPRERAQLNLGKRRLGESLTLSLIALGGLFDLCGGTPDQAGPILDLVVGGHPVEDDTDVVALFVLGFGRSPTFSRAIQTAYFRYVDLECEYSGMLADRGSYFRRFAVEIAKRVAFLSKSLLGSVDAVSGVWGRGSAVTDGAASCAEGSSGNVAKP